MKKNKKPSSKRTAFLHRQINLYKNLNFITSLYAKNVLQPCKNTLFLLRGKISAEKNMRFYAVICP
jgi:hypothetical protein